MNATHQAQGEPNSSAEPDHGRQNALAWFASIVEMVDRLRQAQSLENGERTLADASDEIEDAERQIHESVLSVEVRSGWCVPGARGADTAPAEYSILLSTGGPAARLVGELSEHGEPESARLEWQDWFKPWTEIGWHDLCPLADKSVPAGSVSGDAIEAAKAYLLEFARQFYFGEG